MVGDWWMVLDGLNDRVVRWSPSLLDALRVARRWSGGDVELRRTTHSGLLVVGRLRTYMMMGVRTARTARVRRVALPVAESPAIAQSSCELRRALQANPGWHVVRPSTAWPCNGVAMTCSRPDS